MNPNPGRSFDVRFGPFRVMQEAENWNGTRIEVGRVWDVIGFYISVSRWTLQVVLP